MKYKKNKLRLNEIASAMQGLLLLVKFGLVLIYILKIYRKQSFSILWEKICSIHYLHFFVEKHVPSQILKDFSVENLDTTPSTFHSKFCSEIYLSQIINYWGSIFTLYLTWEALSLVCVLSVFFFFLSLFLFFLFLLVFSLPDTNNSLDSRERRGNYFSCFPLPPAHEHSFSCSRFLPLLFNQSVCNYQIDSWWILFS